MTALKIFFPTSLMEWFGPVFTVVSDILVVMAILILGLQWFKTSTSS